MEKRGCKYEEKCHTWTGNGRDDSFSAERAWVKEWGTPRGCQGWAGKGPEWMEQRKAKIRMH